MEMWPQLKKRKPVPEIPVARAFRCRFRCKPYTPPPPAGAMSLPLTRRKVAYYTVDTVVIPRKAAMKTVSLKLTEALLRKLEQTAKEQGQSKSHVVRCALQEYLNGEQTVARGSFLEAAGDWIGCVEGPGDLSHNPKHMEGFGT